MTLVFTPLHDETHLLSDGSVNISTPFTGNLISIQINTRPDIPLGIPLGYLYQYFVDEISSYAVYSENDCIKLDLPQTDSLMFIPTSYLLASYNLRISYTTVGSVIDGSNTAPLPELITGLPNRVTTLESIAVTHTNRLDTIQSDLEGMSAPNWDNLSGKPASFPPDTHQHTINDVINLPTSLSTIGTRLTNLEASSASNSGKDILEKFRDVVTTSLDFFYADIKGIAADFISFNPLGTQNGTPSRTYRNGITGINSQGGSNAHYFLNHNTLLDIAGDMTYIAIVRTGNIPFGNPSNLQGVLCKQTDSANGHSLIISGDKVGCEFTNNFGTTFTAQSTASLASNTDYLLRVYRTGSTIGVQIGTSPKVESNTFTGTLAIQNSAPVRLGNKVSSTFGFSGIIYLAAICDGIVSDSQWNALNTSYLSILK